MQNIDYDIAIGKLMRVKYYLPAEKCSVINDLIDQLVSEVER